MRLLLWLCMGGMLLMPVSTLFADDALHRAVDATDRSAPFVVRDAARHPYEVLSFLGVQPDSSVVEIWPGGGYWTEILAPYLHDHGTYVAALGRGGAQIEGIYVKPPAQMLSEPQKYEHVILTQLSAAPHEIAPA